MVIAAGLGARFGNRFSTNEFADELLQFGFLVSEPHQKAIKFLRDANDRVNRASNDLRTREAGAVKQTILAKYEEVFGGFSISEKEIYRRSLFSHAVREALEACRKFDPLI